MWCWLYLLEAVLFICGIKINYKWCLPIYFSRSKVADFLEDYLVFILCISCAEGCVLKMSADPSARGNFSLRRIERSWDLLFPVLLTLFAHTEIWKSMWKWIGGYSPYYWIFGIYLERWDPNKLAACRNCFLISTAYLEKAGIQWSIVISASCPMVWTGDSGSFPFYAGSCTSLSIASFAIFLSRNFGLYLGCVRRLLWGDTKASQKIC